MRPSNVAFLAPPEAHLLDISGPAHVFYEAREYGAPVKAQFISLNEQSKLPTSSGLVFADLEPYHQISLSDKDFLFVPGLEARLLLDPHFIKKIKPFLQWMVEQYENGATICSVCTGAFLLAESGLLDGRQCTTHWKYMSRFSKQFPKTKPLANRLFVEDGKVYSSAGVASGIDLALYVLEQQYGSKFASDIAREVVVYLRRGEEDPQLSVFLKYRNHQEDRVHEVQNWLSNHLSSAFTIDDLADKVHTSPRNLTRLFKNTTGITIGTYIDKLRVEAALKLIGEGATVETTASSCGLKSTNQLRQILKKHAGLLPHDIQ